MIQPETVLPLTSGQRQWLHHLRACEAEGQTTVAYAKAHGLKVSSLYTARKALVEMGVLPHPAAHRFQRAQVLSRPAQTPAPAQWQVQVHLPNGVQVAFAGDVEVAKLRQVLRTAASLS